VIKTNILIQIIVISAIEKYCPATISQKVFIVFFFAFDALIRGRIVFFNGGNDDNLYQNICFDHV
jgi:hypothetical protein